MNNKKNRTLLLFTQTYPYSSVAESFLDPEIPYLSKEFEKIIIVPTGRVNSIEIVDRNLPNNVNVDLTFLEQIEKTNSNIKLINLFYQIISTMRSKYFYNDFFLNMPLTLHPKAMISLILHLDHSLKIQKWLRSYIQINQINLSETIFYTYWLSSITTGIAILKEECPKIKLISRAHRADLYKEFSNPHYLPFRSFVLQSINYVFCISKHGQKYLMKQFPQLHSKFIISKLGVPDPGFVNKPSDDDILRLLSCSYVVPMKRLNLIIESLIEIGNIKPIKKIFWTHIGYGPLLSDIIDMSRKCLPKNIEYNFCGFFEKPVITYYKEHNVDIFINVSLSEGIPVSIMEAQSCGIPVIATNVGGNSEIVSDDVGILLDEKSTPTDIASAINLFFDNSVNIKKKRDKSKQNWEENYNSKINYFKFVKLLLDI